MKSFIKLSFCAFLFAFLCACGFQDGSYSAKAASPDSLGYQAYLDITVQDGVITGAEFDAVNSRNIRKSQDTEFAKLMIPATGISPGEISAHYQQLLLGCKSYRKVKVDALCGATVSSHEFADLWSALETSLKKGQPNQVILPPRAEYTAKCIDE